MPGGGGAPKLSSQAVRFLLPGSGVIGSDDPRLVAGPTLEGALDGPNQTAG